MSTVLALVWLSVSGCTGQAPAPDGCVTGSLLCARTSGGGCDPGLECDGNDVCDVGPDGCGCDDDDSCSAGCACDYVCVEPPTGTDPTGDLPSDDPQPSCSRTAAT
jgi:hypothetical protein